MDQIVSRTAARRAVGVVAALVLAAAPLAVAVEAPETTSAPSTLPAPAPTATAPATQPQPGPNGYIVRKGDLSLDVRGDGVFLPAADSYELKPVFKVYGGGLLVTAVAAPGAKVKKGDALLECDLTAFNWATTQAESELAGAKANLQKAASDVALGAINDQMGLKAQEDAVRVAEQTKKWFDELDGPHFLKRVDLMVKGTQNAADDQNDELDQLRKMYKDEELTSATADIVVRRAVRALENTKTILKMQEEVRDKTKQFDYPVIKQRAGDAVDSARQQQALYKAQVAQNVSMRQGGLTAAKVAFEQASKKAAELREDANWFSVKSPTDGVVAYGTAGDGQWAGGDPKVLKVGERIAPAQAVLRVYTPGKMQVVLGIPEAQAFWIEPGVKAKITPAALPSRSYEAACKPADPAPRGGPLGFQLTLDPGDVDSRLLPGMKAAVQIDAGRAEGVVLIPVAAVTAGKVQVRGKDGTVAARPVQTGKSDGQSVEIRDGLTEGEEIILPGKKA